MLTVHINTICYDIYIFVIYFIVGTSSSLASVHSTGSLF